MENSGDYIDFLENQLFEKNSKIEELNLQIRDLIKKDHISQKKINCEIEYGAALERQRSELNEIIASLRSRLHHIVSKYICSLSYATETNAPLMEENDLLISEEIPLIRNHLQYVLEGLKELEERHFFPNISLLISQVKMVIEIIPDLETQIFGLGRELRKVQNSHNSLLYRFKNQQRNEHNCERAKAALDAEKCARILERNAFQEVIADLEVKSVYEQKQLNDRLSLLSTYLEQTEILLNSEREKREAIEQEIYDYHYKSVLAKKLHTSLSQLNPNDWTPQLMIKPASL